MKKHIEGTVDAWESGILGQSEEYAVKSLVDDLVVDESLDLKSISIRMPKPLLEDLKIIADTNNLGYQVLIKKVLHRFVEEEKRIALQEKKAARQAANKEKPLQATG